MCADLWSLSDTNDNKLTTAAVTLGKEHLVNQTDEKKPQFITGSVNKGGNATAADAFLWNKLNLKHD